MLVAAAVCPHPPLLVPQVAAGAAGELDDLRGACAAALAELLAAPYDVLVVVGAGAPWSAPGGRASFDGYGVAVDVTIGSGDARLGLPLSVAAWLLRQAGHHGGVELRTADASTARGVGEALAARTDRVALLAMADGSARRSAQAPGAFDARAEPFDAEVVAALQTGDPAALGRVDAPTADALLAAGWPVWQTLAAAAHQRPRQATLHYAAAPYGVAYTVASWVR